MPGPLDGLIVLDFSTLLPGPMATLFLAEAGAQVIKIERPGRGEEMRGYEPKWGEDSVSFALLNRGKKSLALDLKDAGDAAKLMPWVQRADILVEQFRPGVMDRLGLGYRTLSQINPGLVYCSITGYGQDGPKRDVAGHDLNYIGDAGLLSLSMGTAEQPVLPPALIADIAGGTYPAVLNILLALRERDRTGQGCHLDISMAENVFPFLYWALGAGQAAGHWPNTGDDLVTGGSPRYQLYPTSDGRFVAAAPLEQKFWDVFCRAIALGTDWRDDKKDPAGTKVEVARIIAARSSDEWEPILARADCCCSIVRTPQEAMANAHFRRRRVFDAKIANVAGETIAALPVPIAPAFRASRDQVESAPALGADNAELLR